MIWFYLTPIIYKVSMIPEPYNGYIQLNPLTTIIEMYRTVIIDGMIPSSADYWWSLLYSVGFLLIGLIIFNKRQSKLAEEL